VTHPEEQARRLADEALAGNDPTAWFERLYLAAEDGTAAVPWDRDSPHQMLVEWAQARGLDGAGRTAIVIGCGFGQDAEYVARLGFDTVAFDISDAAVRAAKNRFPDSPVQYVVADLLDPPPAWRHEFDLVVESLTVQALPRALRPQATVQVGWLLADGGTLIVHSAAQRGEVSDDGPPWPLTRAEVEAFATDGVELVKLEDVEYLGVQRWRAEFHRPANGV
jgi:SAM-dependent methyltransferase